MWVHAEKAPNRICRCGLSCAESRELPPRPIYRLRGQSPDSSIDRPVLSVSLGICQGSQELSTREPVYHVMSRGNRGEAIFRKRGQAFYLGIDSLWDSS